MEEDPTFNGGPLANQPEVEPYLSYYWDAFWEITNDRQIHQAGVGGIPFQAIDTFARRYEIEGEDFETLKFFIKRMDDAYKGWISDYISDKLKEK